MTKKSAFIFGVVVIGIAVGIFLFTRKSPTPQMNIQDSSVQLSQLGSSGAAVEGLNPVVVPSGMPALSAPAPRSSAQPGLDYSSRTLPIPSSEQMRAEVAANPHGHPPALMRFAEVLAKKMEDAEHSPEKARALFDELEECLKNRDTTSTILALCYFNAEELSEDFPEFEARTKRAAEILPKDVRQLLETGELLDE